MLGDALSGLTSPDKGFDNFPFSKWEFALGKLGTGDNFP